MAMPKRSKHFYEFGSFRLDPDRHRLFNQGEPIHLSPKAAEALVVLVRNAGKLLEREELMQAVWADSFVEDANLTVAISHLRKALGQNSETAEYIETIPRVGYRFVAEVRERYEEPAPVIIEKHTQSRTVIEEEFLPDPIPAKVLTPEASSIRTRLPRWITQRTALVAAGAFLVLAAGSFAYFHHNSVGRAAASNPALGIRSLAILPPRPLGPESKNDSVSLGIADALIARLGRIRSFTVRPTSAVVAYLDKNADPLDAGGALNVDAVLDGTLQREGGRTRVTLRLLSVANGSQLWASNFDEADKDIFKLEDSISQRVAEALSPTLTQDQRVLLTRQQTTNHEAYVQYLQGNYFWKKRGPEAAKSIDFLRKAVELDPNFAQAFATLAAAEATTGPIPSPEAEALLDKALQLDDTLAEAHATRGFIKMFHYWDWDTAERELDRAIELDPNSALAHHWKGVYLSIRGRLDEAKAELHRALDLDPLSLIIMADLGQLHYFAHEYDQAMEYCNRALAFEPDFWVAHEYLVDIYRAKGMDREVLNEMTKLEYRDSRNKQHVEETFARGGLNAVFVEQLNSSLNRDDRERPTIVLAKLYSRLGDREHALYWLNRALSGQRYFWSAYINIDPVYDPLHNDPRFKEIVNRMGLTNLS